jgi:L-tyrosine C(3)-methyltransferase
VSAIQRNANERAIGGNIMKDDLDFEGLALYAAGHTAFQLLWAGTQLGVFGLLSKKPRSTHPEIAKEIGLQQQPARILLTGLAALRLIIKEGDHYKNSAIAQQILVPDSPQSMVDVLGWQALIVYPGEIDFLESLKRGTNVGLRRFPGNEDNLYERLAHDPVLEKAFHDAMSALSKSANALLAESVDLSKIRHLVDAGGGDGTNAIALARANPHLTVTVFDALSVCERAKDNIAKAGLADRVKTHPGDFFKHDFPRDIDCILFAHMLTIWSAEKDTALLRRAYEALPQGGRVLIFNMMGNDEGTGPLSVALGSPYFLTIATGEGMMYSWKEYERFLSDAGFRQTQRLKLPREHGALLGIK